MFENDIGIKTVWGDVSPISNIELCFTVNIPKQIDTEICLVAKDIYNIFINGKFVSFGPARAAKGYCRIDKLKIDDFLTEDNNIICVYVKSIYSGTLSFCKENPLFGCKITSCGKEIATSDSFSCYLMTDNVVFTERMSRQRGFCEVYDMSVPREKNDFSFYKEISKKSVDQPEFLSREVSYSNNDKYDLCEYKSGNVSLKHDDEVNRIFSEIHDFGEKFGGYERNKCEVLINRELLSFEYDSDKLDPCYSYKIFNLKHTNCGKIQIDVEVDRETTLWVTYDDLLVNGVVDSIRQKIFHALQWKLKKGNYRLISNDVYSFKYLQVISDNIDSIKNVSVICIENSDELIIHRTGNKKIDSIIEASERTFRQNAYDLLTDCPSRERAAWLCDSYFTAKAENFFTEQNKVERNMLENYLLYKNERFNHDGIIPMCYPSHIAEAEENIPGWTFWYILELEDYLKRTGDRSFVLKFKNQLFSILDYFSSFENEYELLENLGNWDFIEWSKASEYTKDVNIPNNILYSEALRVIGELFKDEAMVEKSKRIKSIIISKSFNGTVFCDNLLRINGKLVSTDNHTELCQIFAVYFNMLPNDKSFIDNYLNDFKGTKYENLLDETALFIGEILRILSWYKLGAYKKVVDKCTDIFADMAKLTGTLWESLNLTTSCCHGFASIIGMPLYYSYENLKKENDL